MEPDHARVDTERLPDSAPEPALAGPDTQTLRPDEPASAQLEHYAAVHGRTLAGAAFEAGGKGIVIRGQDTVREIVAETHDKVGFPIHRNHRNLELRRKREPRSIMGDVEYVYFDELDADGNITAMKKQPRTAFNALIDAARPGQVEWPAEEEVPAENEVIPIQFSGTKNRFDEMSDQLEANGITKWDGLTWENAGHTLIVSEDAPVMQRTFHDFRPVRTFSVKMCKDGRTVAQEYRTADTMRDYFSQTNVANLRMVKPKETVDPAAEQLDEREREAYAQLLGWTALGAMPEYERPEVAEARHANNQYLKGIVDLETAGASGDIAVEDRTAVWLLSSPDTEASTDAEATKKLLKRMEKTVKKPEATRRIEGLKSLIGLHDLDKVFEMALKLQDEFKQDMKQLRIPAGDALQRDSMSHVLAALADRQYYAMHPDKIDDDARGLKLGDAFAETTDGERLRADIIDQVIGSAFSASTLKRGKTLRQTTKLNKQGQPKFKAVDAVEFVEKPFENVQEFIKKPVDVLAEKIYHDILDEKAIQTNDYAQIGRLLRRSLAQ